MQSGVGSPRSPRLSALDQLGGLWASSFPIRDSAQQANVIHGKGIGLLPVRLHRKLGMEIRDVTKYGGDGEDPSILLEAQKAIFRLDIALNHDFIPMLRMTDIINRNVVVLAVPA